MYFIAITSYWNAWTQQLNVNRYWSCWIYFQFSIGLFSIEYNIKRLLCLQFFLRYYKVNLTFAFELQSLYNDIKIVSYIVISLIIPILIGYIEINTLFPKMKVNTKRVVFKIFLIIPHSCAAWYISLSTFSFLLGCLSFPFQGIYNETSL